MNNLPKISVCIIAKNEEKMLPDCLSSVKSFAYEIILVDTGSNDKTKEIAKNFGCKVYDFPWIDNFAAARNESLKYVSGDFVLVLDADERLANPDAIRKTIENAKPKTAAWICNMISSAATKNNEIEKNITAVIRFFRYNPEFRFEGIIHEQIIPSILKKGYKLELSEINILHLGYDLSAEEMRKKHLRNLDLLNKWLENHPEDFYNFTHKGKTLLALNKLDEAAKVFDDLIEKIDKNKQKNDSITTKIQVLNYAAITEFRRKNVEKSLNFALESSNLLSNQSFANFILGEIYTNQNNIPKALTSYLSMLNAIENPSLVATIAGEFQLSPEQLYWRIGRSYFALNDLQNAVTFFEKGLKNSPKNHLHLIGLANVAFKLKKYPEAKKILEAALEANPERKEIKKIIAEVENAMKFNSSNNVVENVTIYCSNNHNKQLISVCMIVKNEEKMLEDCLKSVKNIADEIIIVDTGSADNTIEIAKKYDAKIFHFDWIDDFAAARNESIKNATSGWILYLDADERLTENSQLQIRNLVATSSEEVGGYFCLIESEHSKLDGSTEKHKGGYPRLFRNLGFPKIQFMGRVHEQISPSIIAAEKIILTSDIVIEHLGYNLPQAEMEQKVQRNYKMLLAHINEEPTNGYAWFQLGQTLGQMGLEKEAEDATIFAIKCGNLSNSVYASAAATLSQFRGRQKDYEKSLYWAEESLTKAPNQLYGLSLKAHSLLYLGRKKEAEPVFTEAINLSKSLTKSSIPKTGVDIDISEEVLLKGLNESRKN
jgi:glycosyltransferase involved in cell wall biosynthesis